MEIRKFTEDSPIDISLSERKSWFAEKTLLQSYGCD